VPSQATLLNLKQQKTPMRRSPKLSGCTVNQVQKQWFRKLLEQAEFGMTKIPEEANLLMNRVLSQWIATPALPRKVT
jgi:hypothetical protein